MNLTNTEKTALLHPSNRAYIQATPIFYMIFQKWVNGQPMTSSEGNQLKNVAIKLASNPPGSVQAKGKPNKKASSNATDANKAGRGSTSTHGKKPSKPGSTTVNANKAGRGSIVNHGKKITKVGGNVVSPYPNTASQQASYEDFYMDMPQDNVPTLDIEAPVDDSFFNSSSGEGSLVNEKPKFWDRVREKPLPYIIGGALTVGGITTAAIVIAKKRKKAKKTA